jgi:hypothetical protein
VVSSGWAGSTSSCCSPTEAIQATQLLCTLSASKTRRGPIIHVSLETLSTILKLAFVIHEKSHAHAHWTQNPGVHGEGTHLGIVDGKVGEQAARQVLWVGVQHLLVQQQQLIRLLLLLIRQQGLSETLTQNLHQKVTAHATWLNEKVSTGATRRIAAWQNRFKQQGLVRPQQFSSMQMGSKRHAAPATCNACTLLQHKKMLNRLKPAKLLVPAHAQGFLRWISPGVVGERAGIHLFVLCGLWVVISNLALIDFDVHTASSACLPPAEVNHCLARSRYSRAVHITCLSA